MAALNMPRRAALARTGGVREQSVEDGLMSG
jgi:hypothetical protein